MISSQVQRGAYVLDWRSWQDDSSKADATRKQRTIFLKLLSQANSKDADSLISEILSDKLTVYQSASKLLNWLRETNHKPSTVSVYRTLIPPFFKAVLGSQNFDEQAFELLVPNGDSYVSTTKKAPTLEEVRKMVSLASPRDRVLIGLLCSGMRIGEAVSRRMSDLQVSPKGYGRIKLQAKSTKKRRKRFVFLTTEAVKWIEGYHSGLKVGGSETWILPGEKHNHLSEESGYAIFKGSKSSVGLFEKAGLFDAEDEIYSPHSFRSFASSVLRRSGLNDSWVDAIVGQMSRLGAKSHYLDWDQVEIDWFEKAHDNLLIEQKAEPVSLQQRVRMLENELRELKAR